MFEKGARFFCSWSGGKDSCLALHRALKAGSGPCVLLTMMTDAGDRSRSHGLSEALLREQASCLGLPIALHPASWTGYEGIFISAVRGLKDTGISHGVFGDIDLEEHREWVERVCTTAGVSAHEPLWKGRRRDLLREFIDSGFAATIVAVRDGTLPDEFLGRRIDWDLVDDLEAAGVDASGERGEYHTVVTDGPIFGRPLEIESRARIVRDGYRFLDVRPLG
jgi:uncharacterized protein (TIGR00290 family)